MTTSDRHRVQQLLGRAPQGEFTVVVRDPHGDPVVIRNEPLLDDGTPMPTRYWLVGTDAVREVSRLEAAGGIRDAEAAVDPTELADAHARYAAERHEALPPGYRGPAPSGGVGGTRQGVKCLHAHYAWHLAGGDDPVGRWVAARLAQADPNGPTEGAARGHEGNGRRPAALQVTVHPSSLDIELPDRHHVTVDVGPASLAGSELAGSDPPRPEQLTNALGAVADQLENLVGEFPDVATAEELLFVGGDPVALAQLEAGVDEVQRPTVIERKDIEEVFRIVATEPARDRRHNPGLDPSRVDTIVATCCIVLAIARRLELDSVTIG